MIKGDIWRGKERKFVRNMGIIKYFKDINHPLAQYVDNYGLKWEDVDNIIKKHRIRAVAPDTKVISEYPIGVTLDGKVICLPNFNVCPTIAICGSKGSGKSLLSFRLIDCFHHHYLYNVVMMNDFLKETRSHGFPNRTKKFVEILSAFAEVPVPLPIVYLYPPTRGELEIPMPKVQLIIDFQDFANEIEKFVDLGGSYKHFQKLDFSSARNIEDVESIVNTLDTGSKKTDKSVIEKIMSDIKVFHKAGIVGFKDNMFSVSKIYFPGDQSYDGVISQLLKGGLIPSLITAELINKPKLFPLYFRYFLDDLIKHQNEIPEFKNKRLCIFVEELSTIISQKDPGPAMESFSHAILQGRMLNILVMFCTQNISRAPIQLSSNCKYVFCFQQSGDDVKVLGKLLNLKKKEEKEIEELRSLEFIAKTKDEPFRVFDVLNNEWEMMDKVHGFLLPPLSHHTPPPSEKKTQMEVVNTEAPQETALAILEKLDYRISGKKRKVFNYKELNKEVKKARLPRLIESIDYGALMYGRKNEYITISHEELNRMGVIIYKDKFDIFKLCKKNEFKLNIGYPIASVPNDVFIFYNPSKKRVRIAGKRCMRKPLTI